MNSTNICLIGFMGTGKSSVAEEISRKYNKAHIELDKIIEQKAQMRISEMFATYGEEYFRDMETETLKSLECSDAVISCGGGIVLRDENMALLGEKGIVIWLEAAPATVYERIKNAVDRPLLKNNMTVEYIEKLLSARIERYSAAAFEHIYTDAMSIEQVADYIYEKYMK